MTRAQLLDVLGPAKMTTAEVVGRVTGHAEPSKAKEYPTIYKRLCEMAEEGEIERHKPGARWNDPIYWSRP